MPRVADAELTAAALELLAARRDAPPCNARLTLLAGALRDSLNAPHAQLRAALRALAPVVALRRASHAPLLALHVAPALLRAAAVSHCAADALNVLAALLAAPPPPAVAPERLAPAVAQLAMPLLRAPLLGVSAAHDDQDEDDDAAAAAALRALGALARLDACARCSALSERALLSAVHSALLRAVHTARASLVAEAAAFLSALLRARHAQLRRTLRDLRMSQLLLRALPLRACRASVLRFVAELLRAPRGGAPPSSPPPPELPPAQLLPPLNAALRAADARELHAAVQLLLALPPRHAAPRALLPPLLAALPRVSPPALPDALALLARLLSGSVRLARLAHAACAARCLSDAARAHAHHVRVMYPALLALRHLIHCYDRNRAAAVAANLPQLVLLALVQHASHAHVVAAAANVFILLAPADLLAADVALPPLASLLQARLALHAAHPVAAPALRHLLAALALVEPRPPDASVADATAAAATAAAAAATTDTAAVAPRTLSSAGLLRRRASSTRRVVSDFDARRLATLDVPTRSAKRTRKPPRVAPAEPSQEPLADLLARHRAHSLAASEHDASFHSHADLPRSASVLLPSPSRFADDGPSSLPDWPSFRPRFVPPRSLSFDTDEDSDDGSDDDSDFTSNGSFSLSSSESGSFEPLHAQYVNSRQPSELHDALRTLSDINEPQSDSFSTSVAGLPLRNSDVRESSTVTDSAETMDDADVVEESEFPHLASRVFQRAYAKHVGESGADMLHGAKRFAERERNNGTGARPQWSIWPFHSAEENTSLRSNSGRSQTRGESGTIRGRQ